MTYKPKNKQWFMDRIGKKIYRNKNKCFCNTCKEILENGMVVDDEQHADYLACTDNDYANEGVYLNYRDTK